MCVICMEFFVLFRLYFLEASSSICSSWDFTCNNGWQCVRHYDRCDGQRDCYDGSDEWNCRM